MASLFAEKFLALRYDYCLTMPRGLALVSILFVISHRRHRRAPALVVR